MKIRTQVSKNKWSALGYGNYAEFYFQVDSNISRILTQWFRVYDDFSRAKSVKYSDFHTTTTNLVQFIKKSW